MEQRCSACEHINAMIATCSVVTDANRIHRLKQYTVISLGNLLEFSWPQWEPGRFLPILLAKGTANSGYINLILSYIYGSFLAIIK